MWFRSLYLWLLIHGGFSTVSKALGSLLNQSGKVDRVILHVNANKPPDNLPNDSRLDVRLSRTNHADNGKFKYMNEFKGYFTEFSTTTYAGPR